MYACLDSQNLFHFYLLKGRIIASGIFDELLSNKSIDFNSLVNNLGNKSLPEEESKTDANLIEINRSQLLNEVNFSFFVI